MYTTFPALAVLIQCNVLLTQVFLVRSSTSTTFADMSKELDAVESAVKLIGGGTSRRKTSSLQGLVKLFRALTPAAALSQVAIPKKPQEVPTPVSKWLQDVPGARLKPGYWTGPFTGDYNPSPSSPSKWPLRRPEAPRLLEMSTGRKALWSNAVAKAALAEEEGVPCNPLITAGDIEPPSPRVARPPVQPVKLNTMKLKEFAVSCAENSTTYDVIYGAHLLCTCPIFPNIAELVAGTPVTTCGGLEITQESVRRFVQGVSLLLAPDSGVAIFDHECGWPLGLEKLLREESAAANLFFYVRRGPVWTNTNYVLSKIELEDDISRDPLQFTLRASEAGELWLVLWKFVLAQSTAALWIWDKIPGAFSPDSLDTAMPLANIVDWYFIGKPLLFFLNVFTFGDLFSKLRR